MDAKPEVVVLANRIKGLESAIKDRQASLATRRLHGQDKTVSAQREAHEIKVLEQQIADLKDTTKK